jgi:hypothetical protein
MVATIVATRARAYKFIGIDLNVAGELEVRYQRYIDITLLHNREAPSQSILHCLPPSMKKHVSGQPSR